MVFAAQTPSIDDPTRPKRRRCQACALRKVACLRDADDETCVKCRHNGIRCIETRPHRRSTQRGRHATQAVQHLPCISPSATEQLMGANVQADTLLIQLLRSSSMYKVTRMPLMKWINLEDASSRFRQCDPISQALLLSIAAIAVRVSSMPFIAGSGAPSLADLSQDSTMRRQARLAKYGEHRENLAANILEQAQRYANAGQVFGSADLRSVVALANLEFLTLLSHDSAVFPTSTCRPAQSMSCIAASHLRQIFEDSQEKDAQMPWGYDGVLWTLVLRDSVFAMLGGRPLHFTNNDLRFMLGIDITQPIQLPTLRELEASWSQDPEFDNCYIMQVWTCIIQMLRNFVNSLFRIHPSKSGPSMTTAYLELFEASRSCRDLLADAMALRKKLRYQTSDQQYIMPYVLELAVGHAHRLAQVRCLADTERQQAMSTADSSGENGDDLHALFRRSSEEVFQAMRRVVGVVKNVLRGSDTLKAELFVPGHSLFEGISTWVPVLLDVRTREENGRLDYSNADKLSDMRALYEGVAVACWSHGKLRGSAEELKDAMEHLENFAGAANISHSPPRSSTSSETDYLQYLNLSPSP